VDQKPNNVTVIGAGSWGSALAIHLARAGHAVRLWAYEPEVVSAVNQDHVNPIYLPGFDFPEKVVGYNDIAESLGHAQVVVMVVPSHVFRQVLSQAAPHLPEDVAIVSCAKGIEADTGFTMCEVSEDVLPKEYHRSLCCLSGPSFAKEVAAAAPTRGHRGQPLGQKSPTGAAHLCHAAFQGLHLAGHHRGGAGRGGEKPPGHCGRHGFRPGPGPQHLGRAHNPGPGRNDPAFPGQGRPDGHLVRPGRGWAILVLTCTGDLSRNRTVGYRLGQGETIKQITDSMKMVAEGVINTKTVRDLAQEAGVEMPITQSVYGVIYENKPPQEALHELMTRTLRAEHD
jgi:glycerol-3-phosphate dehydrogenase (NAD(P)+)